MSLVRRIFPSATDALRPRLAAELTPGGVVAARPGAVAVAGESQNVETAFASLRPGLLAPGLKGPNLRDAGAVTAALGQALDGLSPREKKVTLVVPDASARVLLLDFDTLPAKHSDAVPIIRFRLRKLVPFEVEDAAVSWQVMPSDHRDGTLRAVVAVMPGPIRAEYEMAAREAGYEPGAMLPSSLAALAAVSGDDAALVVNRNRHSITTAIARGSELLLYRTLDLGIPEAGGHDGAHAEVKAEFPEDPGLAEHQAAVELQRTVSVAMAYFEDTLATIPKTLLAAGPGGAAELARLLGDDSVRVRDLVPSPAGTSQGAVSGTAAPPGLLAGVIGALAS
jgi:type IV pilus assembly protein PilM